ncbi:transcriptional regulator GutM [Streptomyces ipomoeae]|uniref:transcriptional regulator GutM n=1 Tax=Streptomyces ipomoeae TaxID=103232 RepID=UPI0011468DC9|nr:transcriptional regulator GutM [Streptomyces ipomoeae]MDX2935649.1 transcriptional regulator GutM [Streptomyces ipomoeae]TQE15477.1 transcriptional regulator [Streptomyces ipomoeae]
MEYLPLALLLLGGFVLSLLASMAQHRYYLRTVNKLAAQEHRAGVTLVSGRATGRLRGAVVLLLVRRSDSVVERALAMQGASVLARFRERPQLIGELGTAPSRAGSTAMARAVEDARDRYRRMQSGATVDHGSALRMRTTR